MKRFEGHCPDCCIYLFSYKHVDVFYCKNRPQDDQNVIIAFADKEEDDGVRKDFIVLRFQRKREAYVHVPSVTPVAHGLTVNEMTDLGYRCHLEMLARVLNT